MFNERRHLTILFCDLVGSTGISFRRRARVKLTWSRSEIPVVAKLAVLPGWVGAFKRHRCAQAYKPMGSGLLGCFSA